VRPPGARAPPRHGLPGARVRQEDSVIRTGVGLLAPLVCTLILDLPDAPPRAQALGVGPHGNHGAGNGAASAAAGLLGTLTLNTPQALALPRAQAPGVGPRGHRGAGGGRPAAADHGDQGAGRDDGVGPGRHGPRAAGRAAALHARLPPADLPPALLVVRALLAASDCISCVGIRHAAHGGRLDVVRTCEAACVCLPALV